MPTPTKGTRFGGSPAHQRLMLANMASALFEHGRITTTEAKAKRLRPFAERLVTKAKRGDLAARRQVASVIRDRTVVHELFTEIAPGYAGRPGGYTRITKIGPRKGDNAPMAVIELVEPLEEQTVAEATAATKRAAKDRASAEPEVNEQADQVQDEEVVETSTDDQQAESAAVDEDAEAQDVDTDATAEDADDAEAADEEADDSDKAEASEDDTEK